MRWISIWKSAALCRRKAAISFSDLLNVSGAGRRRSKCAAFGTANDSHLLRKIIFLMRLRWMQRLSTREHCCWYGSSASVGFYEIIPRIIITKKLLFFFKVLWKDTLLSQKTVYLALCLIAFCWNPGILLDAKSDLTQDIKKETRVALCDITMSSRISSTAPFEQMIF